MKVHYINILLFAFPLNILVYNQWNHKSTTHHTPKVPTTRLLYECELYIPNYDNDPEMKRIMQQFDDRTSQRFHEYDNRMIEKQQKCKDQCDKEIQKIILKDKLEKELMEKFATLQTDIQNDAIPTCVCEKSLADKTEKFCLKCGKTMGAVAPAWGLLSVLCYAEWLNAAMIAAEKASVDAGIVAAIDVLKVSFDIDELSGVPLKTILNANNFKNTTFYISNIQKEYNKVCLVPEDTDKLLCLLQGKQSVKYIEGNAQKAVAAASKKATDITTEEVAKITSASSTYSTAIIASVVAILVIILIMIIIYLILRYRRKKKMKKKMQYIKLLKE
ncbi:hypothetical protein PFTANZ_02361 [Plasmodium falciparum Tanzania (2000708)]|uniref:Surface antigen n=1 Tax=Plasmodium falciparum Tanzania (2000708) TaxID=1036725 RepID=A0A024W8S6_PLAFA|nr:hypothetical protein PFTANZ_02361 [Plasmodium falciparum Tanzania (2000708)]